MNEHSEQQLARAGMAASVIAALGASICCIGPVLAAMFGLTSLAALAKYEHFRPIFGAGTALFLGVAFYMTYRRPADECDSGAICATPPMRRLNRIILWIAAVVAAIVLTFPTWSGWILT
jgi:mercuric ion transport protein